MKKLKNTPKNFGLVWYQFLKTVFCSQKQGEQGKHGEHLRFPSFFCSEKHKEHERFLENTILVFFVFSKTVLVNSSQKQEPDKPFIVKPSLYSVLMFQQV